MNRPCSIAITCESGADSPITNLSSESSDGPEYIGIAWPVFNPTYNDPFGWNAENWSNTPVWWAYGCLSTCSSPVSQSAANQCATNQTFLCTTTPPPGTHPLPPGPGFFYNVPQTCVFNCPNGTQNSYTVPAGTIVAGSQALADHIAYQEACAQAAKATCQTPGPPGPPPPGAPCTLANFLASLPDGTVGVAYSSSLTATAGAAPYTFSVVGGVLPDGLSMDSGGNVTGTPTTGAGFSCTVQMMDSAGHSCTKNLNISIDSGNCIVEGPTLADGNVCQDYNPGFNPLTVDPSVVFDPGMVALFSIGTGALPDGLSIEPSSGIISGKPTVAGTFTFQVCVNQQGGGN